MSEAEIDPQRRDLELKTRTRSSTQASGPFSLHELEGLIGIETCGTLHPRAVAERYSQSVGGEMARARASRLLIHEHSLGYEEGLRLPRSACELVRLPCLLILLYRISWPARSHEAPIRTGQAMKLAKVKKRHCRLRHGL